MPRINVVIAGDAAKLNKALAASERRMKKFASGLKTVGDGIFTAVGVPFIAAGAAGVKAAVDFEASMSKIKGLVGVTGKELKDLENAALSLGPQFGKSAGEAADALYFITSAGLDTKNAIEVLEYSLKASAAGLGETKVIADLTTSAMNAYGADVLKASAATDTLTAAIREGKLEPETLAGAMGAVLPIASALGVQFHEVGAAFASMSRTGTPAAEAATQLKSILATILDPSEKGAKALEDMGLNSEMLQKQLVEKGLLSVLQTLREKFDGNNSAAAEVLGNIRALTGYMDMMGKGAASTEEIFGTMSETMGDTDRATAAAAQTMQYKMNVAMAKINAASIKLGNTLIPIVGDIADSLIKLADWWINLDESTRKSIVSTLKWTTLIAGGASVLGRMISGVANLSRAFRNLGGAKAIAAVVSGFKALTTTGTTANIAVRMLGIGLKSLWVSAIAPLAVAVGTLSASLEGLTRAMTMNNEIGSAARQMFTQNEVVRTLTTGYWKLKESLFGVKEGQEKAEETGTDMNEMLGALNLNVSNTADALKDTAVKTTELTEAQKKNLQTLADLRKELDFINKKQELFGENLGEEKIDAYTSAIEELLRNGLNPMSTAVQKLKGEMDALYKSMMPKTDPLKKIQSGSERFGLPGAIEGGETGLVPPKGLIGTNYDNNTPGDIQTGKSADELAKIAAAFDMASNAGQRFADIFQDAAESTGSAVEKMGKVIMGVAKEIIKSALLSALSQWIASSMTKLGIFGVPIAGAGYGIIQGLFNKGNGFNVPALAEGGMTTRAGYAMIGDNPSGKEFVIPYEKMGDFARRAMGGSNMNLSGQFVVRGSDLVLALERENRKLINQRGYGLNQ